MTKRRSPPLTAEMAATIKFLVAHKKYLQHQAAAQFGINQGRVSEIMTGKLFPEVPPADNDDQRGN
ncbi:MAG TPA: hypothetical protein PKA57_09775 [Parvibaculum sp.]|nr:hypothetical protein [Parvibaculum sp.]